MRATVTHEITLKPLQAAVLRAVATLQATGHSEVTARTGAAENNVRYVLKRLTEYGLLTMSREKVARTSSHGATFQRAGVVYRLTETGMAACTAERGAA